jgi:hypothetical protein
MTATFQHRPPDQRHQHQVERGSLKRKKSLSVFQGSNNKKEKKKNNSGEDDLTYGPRDNVIGNKSSSIKLYLV